MKRLSLISVATLVVIIVAGLTARAPARSDPRIEVAPLEYDLGDVVVGTTGTTIITISNADGNGLIVYAIGITGSSPDFSITMAPALPANIDSGSTEDIWVTFCPSSEGYSSAVLEITNDDPTAPLVTVSLGGVGVLEEQHPTSVADILAFFDASVADGTLVGNGPGASADGRRNALRNMIEAAGDLIDGWCLEEACQQLLDAYQRADGLSRPPEFVAGPAAPTLAEMIVDLMVYLGCY